MIPIDKKYKRIWICGHEVRIQYRTKLSADGFFHADKDLIQIKLIPTWKDTLLHEILHAVLYYSGHSQKFEENDEEALVMALENGLKTLMFS